MQTTLPPGETPGTLAGGAPAAAAPAAPKPTHNELVKEGDPTLAGAIAQTLADPQADHFTDDDTQFLKAHGIYQQDDRDLRKTGKKYILMVRCRIPGGVLTPAQYLACDDLADRYGDHTLRVTSRQSFQFHGVAKGGVRALVKGINDALLSTLAGCGDNIRNVLAPPTPAIERAGARWCTSTRDRWRRPSPRAPRPTTRSGLMVSRSTWMRRRTGTSLTRSTARLTCRASSRSPSLSRP